MRRKGIKVQLAGCCTLTKRLRNRGTSWKIKKKKDYIATQDTKEDSSNIVVVAVGGPEVLSQLKKNG